MLREYKIGELSIRAVLTAATGWGIRVGNEKEAIHFKELDEDRALVRAAVLAGIIGDEIERQRAEVRG